MTQTRPSSAGGAILYCHCAYSRNIADGPKLEVLAGLLAAGVEFRATPDLCRLSAVKDSLLAQVAADCACVVACFPRAVAALFDGAGAPLPKDAAIINLKAQPPKEILSAVSAIKAGSAPAELTQDKPLTVFAQPGTLTAGLLSGLLAKGCEVVITTAAPTPQPPRRVLVLGDFRAAGAPAAGQDIYYQDIGGLDDQSALVVVDTIRECIEAGWDTWVPWFPTIDYAACVQCKQCLSFCLFGVYQLRDQRVVVENPRNCKTYCPACARVCGKAAIIFPKYAHGPINGNPAVEETRQDVASAEHGKLGANVLAALKQRRDGGKLDPQAVKRMIELGQGGAPGTGKPAAPKPPAPPGAK